jgi:carbon starvation protein
VRAGGLPTTEDDDVPSRLFAPSGFLPTDVEKEVEKQWAARELAGTRT